MWIIAIGALIAGVYSTTVDVTSVDVTPECAACQMFAIALNKNLVAANKVKTNPMAHCFELPQCQSLLTHCQIVKSLAAAPISNISAAVRPRFEKVHSFLESVVHQCELEPHAQVLADKPGPALCTLCFLIYYFFQFMNNGILQMPLLQLVPDVIKLTCMIVMNLNHDIPPPVCEALLADGALDALLKAIADSMGSFYNLIAVQGMGCPPYETLFGVC